MTTDDATTTDPKTPAADSVTRKPRTPETIARKLLWKLYPQQDAFIRRLPFSYSAEVVEPGQRPPPFRTQVIAEASTLEELTAQLEALQKG